MNGKPKLSDDGERPSMKWGKCQAVVALNRCASATSLIAMSITSSGVFVAANHLLLIRFQRHAFLQMAWAG